MIAQHDSVRAGPLSGGRGKKDCKRTWCCGTLRPADDEKMRRAWATKGRQYAVRYAELEQRCSEVRLLRLPIAGQLQEPLKAQEVEQYAVRYAGHEQ
jgi:hypothetical protein